MDEDYKQKLVVHGGPSLLTSWWSLFGSSHGAGCSSVDD